MTVAYPQSSRNGLAGVIQTRCNAGAGGPRLYLAEAGGALPATGILGFVELADFGAPADGVTVSPSNGNIGSATASGTIAEGIYADSDGNEVHRTDDVGVGAGFEISLDRLDVIAGDRIKLLADVSYTSSLTSPLQVAGLSAWIEGPQATGFGTAGFQVPDLTGNGVVATQATPASQPAVTAGGLVFGPAAQSLSLNPLATLLRGKAKVTLMWHLENVSGVRFIATSNSSGSNNDRFGNEFNGAGAGIVGAFGSLDNVSALLNYHDDDDRHALTYSVDGAAFALRSDGVNVRTATLAAPRFPDNLTSMTFSSGSFQYIGILARIFAIVGRTPTAAELAFLESYTP